MQVDKHVPPHLLLLSVTTSITSRLHSKAKDNSIKKQLHFSATASEDVVVSSWGQQISAWLGRSNFIMHSKANPARRHHQVFLEELLVLAQSELWLSWEIQQTCFDKFCKMLFSLWRLPNPYPSIMAAKTWQCRSLESLLPLLIVVKLGC